jgi:pyridoxamine 5'-phosphate oxidase
LLRSDANFIVLGKLEFDLSTMTDIASIRNEYTKTSLDIENVHPDPIIQFDKWLSDAVTAKLPEPTAMSLATVNQNGIPGSRIVLLKGVENGKFVFFTNYQSRKGVELEHNPACSVTFFWPELERQVRIDGVASRIGQEASDAYFKSRPRQSQIGAWASPQSIFIADRSILEQRVKQLEEKYKDQETLPRPHQWGGYGIDPFSIEFWQGRPSRLHDRIVYSKTDNQWKINRLAP